jgi:hypothetical protein
MGSEELSIRLADCLERKLGALRDFLIVTESLKVKCGVEELGEIPQLLDRREELMYTVNWIDDQIQKIGSGLTQNSNGYIGTVHAIQDVLTKIKILDDQCLDKVTSSRERIKNELLEIRNGFKATHCYANKLIHQPRFLDLKR